MSSELCIFVRRRETVSSFVPPLRMPNHVRNTVTVSGQCELLALVDKAVRRDEELPFDFNRIVPKPAVVDLACPTELSLVTQKNHPNRNWYDWCIVNWGTKWNAYDFEAAGTGKYTFYTAWDPPVPVVRSLSRLFPEVEITLEFDEPGMGIYGFLRYKNGREVN